MDYLLYFFVLQDLPQRYHHVNICYNYDVMLNHSIYIINMMYLLL